MNALFRKFDGLLLRRPRIVLAGYWLFCMIVTHVPPIFAKEDGPREERLIGIDKVAHFVGYAGLAFVLMNALVRSNSMHAEARTSDSGVGKRSILLTLLICAVYGIIDELTQPPFGRTADPADWVADVIGAVVGIAFFVKWTRRSVRRGASS